LGQKNIFEANKTYDFFEVYGPKEKTEQTFDMYIGKTLPLAPMNPDIVKLIRVNIAPGQFLICPGTMGYPTSLGNNATTLNSTYNSMTGILSVNLNLSAYAKNFADVAQAQCVPNKFCIWNAAKTIGSKCVGQPTEQLRLAHLYEQGLQTGALRKRLWSE
jgi:hypothetical protein